MAGWPNNKQEDAMTEGKKDKKRKRGRPPKPVERIPDSFENIVKALVRPVKEKG